MKIKEILGIENARLLWGNPEDNLSNFSKDTRTLVEGSTYIGIKGENFDGNTFFEEAFKKGAQTCIIAGINVDETIATKYSDKNLIYVDDTLKFLTQIASIRRNSLNIPVIAVTGSVGKTSTKNIIADILSLKYKVLKTSGNLNTDIGLSLTILSITDEEIMVLEMGMNHPGEIRTLTNIAKPNIAVITNIGTAHIGYLGSRENILKAKLEILEGLQDTLIINNDNDLLHDWLNKNNIKEHVITYGIDTKSHYQASNITYDNLGSHYNLDYDAISINVFGKHFIYNSLVALIIGDIYQIPRSKIIQKLKSLTIEPGRMELINSSDITIINDTYNASYDSVYYALEVLSSFKGRRIAVLGDIFELGDFAEEIHRNIGKLIPKNNIDILVTVGKLSTFINEEAKNLSPKNNYHFNSNEEAINFLNENKQENDTILIKASHGMNFIEIVESLQKRS